LRAFVAKERASIRFPFRNKPTHPQEKSLGPNETQQQARTTEPLVHASVPNGHAHSSLMSHIGSSAPRAKPVDLHRVHKRYSPLVCQSVRHVTKALAVCQRFEKCCKSARCFKEASACAKASQKCQMAARCLEPHPPGDHQPGDAAPADAASGLEAADQSSQELQSRTPNKEAGRAATTNCSPPSAMNITRTWCAPPIKNNPLKF
jgi:hypothetical protein